MKIQKVYKNTNQSHTASHCCQSPVPCKSADYGNIRRVKQLYKILLNASGMATMISLPGRPPFSISISFDFFTSSISYEITFCFYTITPYLGTLIFLKQVLYFLLKFFEFGYIDVDDCLAAGFLR